ncbi:MAG: hypothetical protein IJ300_01890 [Clostridia bacterium]|nr:hypothetical protein [Clostridia bacterium]
MIKKILSFIMACSLIAGLATVNVTAAYTGATKLLEITDFNDYNNQRLQLTGTSSKGLGDSCSLTWNLANGYGGKETTDTYFAMQKIGTVTESRFSLLSQNGNTYYSLLDVDTAICSFDVYANGAFESVYFGTSGSATLSAKISLATDYKWHNVALVYYGEGGDNSKRHADVYVDGVYSSTKALEFTDSNGRGKEIRIFAKWAGSSTAVYFDNVKYYTVTGLVTPEITEAIPKGCVGLTVSAAKEKITTSTYADAVFFAADGTELADSATVAVDTTVAAEVEITEMGLTLRSASQTLPVGVAATKLIEITDFSNWSDNQRLQLTGTSSLALSGCTLTWNCDDGFGGKEATDTYFAVVQKDSAESGRFTLSTAGGGTRYSLNDVETAICSVEVFANDGLENMYFQTSGAFNLSQKIALTQDNKWHEVTLVYYGEGGDSTKRHADVYIDGVYSSTKALNYTDTNTYGKEIRVFTDWAEGKTAVYFDSIKYYTVINLVEPKITEAIPNDCVGLTVSAAKEKITTSAYADAVFFAADGTELADSATVTADTTVAAEVEITEMGLTLRSVAQNMPAAENSAVLSGTDLTVNLVDIDDLEGSVIVAQYGNQNEFVKVIELKDLADITSGSFVCENVDSDASYKVFVWNIATFEPLANAFGTAE